MNIIAIILIIFNESTLKSSFKSVIAKDEVLKQSLDCELLKLRIDCFVSSFLAMTYCFVLVQKGLFRVNSYIINQKI